MRLLRGSRSEEMEGRELSRVWPVLLLGSGDADWGAEGTGGIGGGEMAVGDPRRELRGLNIEAKTDRRRVEPDPDC